MESYKICEFILKNLPAGPIAVKAPQRAKPGEVVSRYEAPRGENIHYIKSNGTDKPERLKVRAPTLANYPATVEMLTQRLHRRHPAHLRRHRSLHLLRRADGRARRRPERARNGSSASATSRRLAAKRAARTHPPQKERGMAALKTVLYLLVYPGLLFLFVYSHLLRVVRPEGLRPAPEPDGPDPHRPLRHPPAGGRLRQAPGQGRHRPGPRPTRGSSTSCRSSAWPSSSRPACCCPSGTSTGPARPDLLLRATSSSFSTS